MRAGKPELLQNDDELKKSKVKKDFLSASTFPVIVRLKRREQPPSPTRVYDLILSDDVADVK